MPATLKEAFEEAGYKSEPDKREAARSSVLNLALAAWAAHPEPEKTLDRYMYMRAALENDLTYVLLQQHQPTALRESIHWRLRTAAGGAAAPPKPKVDIAEMARRQRIAHKSKVEEIVRQSRLETIMVFGKPIGDCSVSEVRLWIDAREREAHEALADVRFAKALVSNLTGNVIIRETWRDMDEVEKLYERAR